MRGESDGFGANFGFTAILSEPANQISAEVYFQESASQIVLSGFDSTGTLVSQELASPDPFTLEILEIDSTQYNITSFQISAEGGGEGYDNVSYTYLPEPSALFGLMGITGLRTTSTKIGRFALLRSDLLRRSAS